jgi:hypothetical protein
MIDRRCWVLFALALVSCGRGRSTNRAAAETSSAHSDRALPTADQTAPHGGGESDVTAHQACRWPGWYRAPRLAADCAELCVPDDVKSAVPTLRWTDKGDWCAGCRALDTPWATTDDARKDAVGSSVNGDGPHGEYVTLGIGPETEPTWAVFGSGVDPIAAWRTDYSASPPCGILFGPILNGSGKVAGQFISTPAGPQLFSRVPLARAAELMTSTTNDFVWDPSFTRERGINGMWFDSALVAADFSGTMGLGDLATGKALAVDAKLTGQPGTYNQVQLVGRSAFVSRSDGVRTDWWLVKDGKARLVLGDEDHDIMFMVTDGTTIFWNEGSQPAVTDQPPGRIYQRHDLYSAPYSEDVKSATRTMVLADLPPGFSWPVLQNGYLVGIYNVSPAPLRTAAMVVRIGDGRVWRSLLPGSYSWNAPLFPATDELWGPVTSGPALLKSETIVRYPYAKMELVQDHGP